MAEKQMLNLNDAILACNADTCFENYEPYSDYSKIVWKDGSPIVSKEDAEAKLAELNTAQDAEIAQKATDKANGNQKLLDLGLTQAEVDAITK